MNTTLLKTAARVALDAILLLFVAFGAAVAVALTNPAHAEHRKKTFTFENKLYKLECKDKSPDGCMKLLDHLRQHDEDEERRRLERIQQQKRQDQEEKESLREA